MSNTIKGVVRTTLASLTMASTVLGLGGFAAVTPALAVAPADFGLKEGDVIKAAGDIDLYIINEYGYKRLFTNPQIFNLYGHLGGWSVVKEVSASVRDAFMTSPFFRVVGDSKVWAIEVTAEDTACLHWVNVSEADAKAKYPDFANMIFTINTLEPALYCVGADYTSMAQVQMYARGGATPTTSTSPLSGSVGEIVRADWISSLNNEEVGEGQSNIKVAGLEIEAGQDSDIRLISAKLKLENTGGTSSFKPRDYMKSVSVYFAGSKVATIDASDLFDDTGNTWTKTVSLPDSAVVRMEDAEKLEFAVSALDVIDSNDHDSDAWQLTVVNVRFVDGQGAITTEDAQDDIGTETRAFDFDSFAGAADIELNLTKASSHPDAAVVEVASESDTEGVLLFSGTLKNKGDEDVLVKELAFNIATLSANLEDVVNSLTLEIDGDDVQSIDPGSADCTSATVAVCTFDDVDVDFNDGESKSVKLYAEVAASEGQEGAQVKASLTLSDAGNVVEDSNGDDISSGDKTGSVAGEYQEFRSYGIQVSLVSTAQSKTTGDNTPDQGEFVIKYSVTAFGGDVYVQEGCSGDLTSSGSAEFVLTSGGVASVSSSCTLQAADSRIDDDSAFGNFEVLEGETETFTLTVVENGAGTFVNVRLEGIDWATSDVTDPANFYESNLDDFKTDDLFLSST